MWEGGEVKKAEGEEIEIGRAHCHPLLSVVCSVDVCQRTLLHPSKVAKKGGHKEDLFEGYVWWLGG